MEEEEKLKAAKRKLAAFMRARTPENYRELQLAWYRAFKLKYPHPRQ
jgi:hypothetical protein